MVDFCLRQWAQPWAAPALIAVLIFLFLFALAGQTVNAPFVYTPPA